MKILQLHTLALASIATIGVVTLPHTPAPRTVTPVRSTSTSTEDGAVRSVLAIGNTVSDLDRSVDFYTKVLSFEKIDEHEVAGESWERLTGVFGMRARVATLRLGSETVRLTQYLAPEGRPIPVDSRCNDRWFQHIAIAVADMERAYTHLRSHKVRHTSTGPQTLPEWNKDAGGIKAFYFKDPDGHALEIIWFPEGKGSPRWKEPTERLFLGIDHTAIVVRDTEASLRFYRGALGMRIAGAAENYGTEQEHLNNVFGARLRITALRAPGGGPGVELLEYLAPSDGRDQAYPGSTVRDNDLVSWHISMATPELDRATASLREAHAAFVSPGAIQIRSESGALRALDPDGHVVEFIQDARSTATQRGLYELE